MPSSFAHIMPTVIAIGIIIVLFFIFYLPISAFEEEYESYVDYIKENVFLYFDALYFLCSKMMIFFIGKVMSELLIS